MAQTTTVTKRTTTDTDEHVERETHAYATAFQLMNFVLGVIETFLLLRFILRLTGANPAAGFVRLVYSVAEFFTIPFRFIFPSTVAEGVVVEWSVLFAMVAYALIFMLIKQFITVTYSADRAD